MPEGTEPYAHHDLLSRGGSTRLPDSPFGVAPDAGSAAGADVSGGKPARPAAAVPSTPPPERPPEHESRILSLRHVARQESQVIGLAASFWEAALGVPRATVTAAAEEFFRLYPERPVQNNSGGSAYADCFWLYTAARLLGPRLLVESGVHRGQTSWLLRHACPDARLYAVDVDLGALVYRDPSIHYHQGDWTELGLEGVDPTSALAFFDDHVSQARRTIEAHARGFRTLLFDDDLDATILHATGAPPVPTIAMVLDDTLEPGERIEWLRRGRPRAYVVDPVEIGRARALIRVRHVTPDLTPILRLRPQGGLSLVRLVA